MLTLTDLLELAPSSPEAVPGSGSAPARGRGRPRDTSGATRARHLACARLRLVMGWSLRRCGEAHGVSPATAHRWVRIALSYPEAEGLRRLAGIDRGERVA